MDESQSIDLGTRQDSISRGQANALIWLLALVSTVLVASALRPTRWEYRVEAPADDVLLQELNQLGASGWEVITARRATGEDFLGSRYASYEMIMRRRRMP